MLFRTIRNFWCWCNVSTKTNFELKTFKSQLESFHPNKETIFSDNRALIFLSQSLLNPIHLQQNPKFS